MAESQKGTITFTAEFEVEGDEAQMTDLMGPEVAGRLLQRLPTGKVVTGDRTFRVAGWKVSAAMLDTEKPEGPAVL